MEARQASGAGRLLGLLVIGLLMTSCVTTPAPSRSSKSVPVSDPSIDALISNLRRDQALSVAHRTNLERAIEYANRPRPEPPTTGGMLASLTMPVVGVWPWDLEDNFGAPREGGRRHRGIDIFAPRGTKVLAVSDSVVSYIGVQAKGGRCLWLKTDQGISFYYAHLDRWVTGLQEGMRIPKGGVNGYVGNTGNARNTPPHLHFQIHGPDDEPLDPFVLLSSASAGEEMPILSGGFGR